MSENTELLKQVEKLLAWKKSKQFMAEKLGVTLEELNTLLSELKGNEKEDSSLEMGNRVVEVNNEKGTLTSSIISNFEPKSIEDLVELHKVDLLKYKVSSYWTKQKGDKFTSSLHCTLLKSTDFSPKDFAEFLKDFKAPVIRYKEINSTIVARDEVEVLISIADFHLDRLTPQKDQLESKSIEYINIVRKLAENSASIYRVNKFIFVIGNDFFNSDTFYSTTTNGTQQNDNASFSEAYEKGFSTLVESILILNSISKEGVDVVLVQGNHDRTKSYYLAHGLSVFFKDIESVKFDREDTNTKYIVSGSTFIGLHHGNTKIDELPLLFATSSDSSTKFGISKYREILTADKHHYMAKEIKGVRIQQMPSLTNPSRWECDNNFLNNIRAGIAIVYHPIKGRVGEIEERL